MLPIDMYVKLQLLGLPGWDKTPEGKPYLVTLYHEVGTTMSSLEVASKWDDIGKGQFYYADQTKSGMPWVDEGETYVSRFVFQFEKEAGEFTQLFVGKI